METKLKFFSDPIERWSALFLAAALTMLLFAAIDAGFSVHGSDAAKLVSALRVNPITDYHI